MDLEEDPATVGSRLPDHTNFDLLPAPLSTYKRSYYTTKTAVLRKLYEEYIRGREEAIEENGEGDFGAYQQAIFVILSRDTLNTLKDNTEAIKTLGDIAQPLVRFFISGELPDDAEKEQTQRSRPRDDMEPSGEDVSVEAAHTSLLQRTVEGICATVCRLPKILNCHRQSIEPAQTATQGNALQPGKSDANIRKRRLSASSETPLARVAGLKFRRVYDSPHWRQCSLLNSVSGRDKNSCIITGKKGGLSWTYILPPTLNSTPEAVSYLRSLAPVFIQIFGQSFANRLENLLVPPSEMAARQPTHVGSQSISFASWNMVTLNGYLHMLYTTGLVGFRPIKLTKGDYDGCPVVRVHFGIHWLSKTKARLREGIELTYDSISEMLEPLRGFAKDEAAYTEFDVEGNRIADGREYTVVFSSVEEAQNMYDCFAISWTMRMVLFLAGCAGNPDGDVLDDEYLGEVKYYRYQDLDWDEIMAIRGSNKGR